jgi:hypothetical protein
MDASCYGRDARGITRKGYDPRRRVDRWFFDVPYGMWTLTDGREVLFNRFYAPIGERDSPTSEARRTNTRAWVKWKRQEHYFNDGSFRAAERSATLMKLNSILLAWGLPRLRQPPR